jgi:hypothetical protein
MKAHILRILDSSCFAVACVTAIVLGTGSASLAQVAGGTILGRVRESSEGARDLSSQGWTLLRPVRPSGRFVIAD